MIQKQYRAGTLEEYRRNLSEISESREYNTAKTVMARIYIECHDVEVIKKAASMARARLPKAVIFGMTNVNGERYDFSNLSPDDIIKLSSIVIDLVCMDTSSVDVEVYDCEKTPELIAGGQVGLRLSNEINVKGVELLVAGIFTSVEDFIVMASAENTDIPVFGSKAFNAHCDIDNADYSYVFFNEQVISKGILVVYWKGPDLNIRTGYNFGWSPIGKKMTVTKMLDEQRVTEIDGYPAAHVYRKYLGLKPELITAENVCEFPFGVQRGNRILARIGLTANDADNPNDMFFSAPVHEGEEFQFTYGNRDIIFAETFADAMEVMRFEPQAIYLIACMNRSTLLKKDVNAEHDFYRNTLPELMIVHGQSEILFDSEGGGELNSALVSVAMREGEPQGKEPWFNGFEGAVCPYKSESIPLVQRMTKFLEATTRDLADAVEKANQANKAKTQFLSSISHEIRTPINAVLGMDEMILRESREPQIRNYAASIQNSGRTLLSLINDLLDSSRIDSGKLEIMPVEYELSSLLNDLVNMTSVRADEKDLELKVNVANDIPHVLLGDDTRIKQCALNILTNAVKYTEQGSVTIDVDFKKTDDRHIDLSFSVTDTGIGIKEEDIDKLFVAYERIEEQRNRNIEGTGLGMNIVTALLSMMDSKLDVKSVYGEGSVFSFVVSQEVINWEPMGDFTEMYRRSIESIQNYHESFHAPDARLLVVDDTRMNLTVFSGLLKATQIQIDTAESGKEALKKVKNNSYDIIFLDQKMPGMDGIETLRRMKHMYENRNHGVPVIMLTANAVAGAREMFLSEGFDDYLSKPINGKKLERMIRERLPEEKVIIPDPDEDKSSDDSLIADSPFLQGLAKIDTLSVSDGLTNCMNEEIYKATINDFVTSAGSNLNDIQGFMDSNDIENYTIRVHALKSSARIIGANDLSEQAKYLESCGDESNIEEIRKNTPKLLQDYQDITEKISEVLNGKEPKASETEQAAKSEEKNSIDDSQIKSALDGVKDFITVYDYDGAADILKMLSDFDLPAHIRKLVSTLSEHITKLERDELLEKLSN